ncbi:MAG: nitroreductase family protein [Planctomycetota bacterium]|nr:nitroreductase family protein [Planctomycetota bacterium]
MDVFDAIKWRRSVRSYNPHYEVSEWQLNRLLEAARLAPSGKNRQATRLIVIRDRERKKRLAVLCHHQGFVASASLVIAAVSIEPDAKMGSGTPAHRVDAAIMLDHIALEATELGLGTCWLGAYDKEKLSEFLEIPKECELIALLAVGEPKDGWHLREADRLPLEELVFYEKFGVKKKKE